MKADLSVIVATQGRPTLEHTLQAIRIQHDGQVIVVADADRPGSADWARRIAHVFGCDFHQVPHGYGVGANQRNHGITQATGTHLAFIDDDDIHTRDGLQLMAEHAQDRPVIFRMFHPQLGLIWRQPVFEINNVGTPMFVVPNDPARLGHWHPVQADRGCDWGFISTCQMDEPVFRSEIVALIRPDL